MKINVHAPIGAAIALLLSAAVTSGASRWYTARTINGQTQPLSAGTTTMLDQAGRRHDLKAVAVSNGLVDIVVSLYNNPTGDDNGNTQDVDPDSMGQDDYEKIIQYFADGVYEATEGVHALRNVRVFRNGSRQDADVIWEHAGGPRSGFMNQDGIAAKISMFNHFDGVIFTNAAGHEGGGYCLAHEFGHYFYALLDEYCRWDGGVYPVAGGWAGLAVADKSVPCIMNRQWSACGRDYRWLNHSIWHDTNTAGFIAYECRPRTAQFQFYGDGAWVTLARSPDDDPQDTADRRGLRERWGKRIEYPEIAAVAPAGTNPPCVDLSNILPLTNLVSRQNLNIIWMDTNIVMMIVLDKSGSMERYERMAGAKAAAKLLVDQLPDGSALGVMAFNEQVEIVRALSVLTNAAQRAAINAAIDGIVPEGWTAMGDAAAAALDAMQAFGHAGWIRTVFLLSDGQSNIGADPLTPAAGFQNGQIPVMAFGFGDEAEMDARLPALAELTGGRYRYAPDSLADIMTAFADALTEITGRHNLLNGILPANIAGARDATVNTAFDVDATIADLRAEIGHDLADTANIALRAPDGALHYADATNQNASERVLSFAVNAPVTGTWHIAGTAAGDLRCQINAGVTGFTYQLSAVPVGGAILSFPAPLVISARLDRGPAIAGAVVSAAITDSDGCTANLALTADATGAYRGIFMPQRNGRHNVFVSADNSAGTAVFTWHDALPAATQAGELPPMPSDEPVNENFSRAIAFQVVVTNIVQVAAPGAPAGVAASAGDRLDYVRVSWQSVTNASVYEIWRADGLDTVQAVKVGETGCANNDYMDADITPGERYYYWVKAVNHAGASVWSAAAQGWPLFGPAIRVNDMRELSLGAINHVVVTALLRTGRHTGLPCDWWVAAENTDAGVFYYLDGAFQWQMSAVGVGGLRPVYTGPVFDIGEPYTVLNTSNLPMGTYRFYFGLDWTPNGILDFNTLIYDNAILNVL